MLMLLSLGKLQETTNPKQQTTSGIQDQLILVSLLVLLFCADAAAVHNALNSGVKRWRAHGSCCCSRAYKRLNLVGETE